MILIDFRDFKNAQLMVGRGLKRQRGVTLLEIITALAIGGFAFAGIYSFFHSAVTGYAMITAQSEETAQVRYVSESVRSYIDSFPQAGNTALHRLETGLELPGNEIADGWWNDFRNRTGIWAEGEFEPFTSISTIALVDEDGFAMVARKADGSFTCFALFMHLCDIYIAVDHGNTARYVQITDVMGEKDVELQLFYYDRNNRAVIMSDNGGLYVEAGGVQQPPSGLGMMRTRILIGSVYTETVSNL